MLKYTEKEQLNEILLRSEKLRKKKESLPYMLIRGMAVGVMHIVSGLAVSFGLIIARRYRMLSLAGITGALGLSTSFHALYNLLVSEPGISSVIGYGLPIVTAAVFHIAYRRQIRTKE